MQVASMTALPSSTSIGKRLIGQRCASSTIAGLPGPSSRRGSKGVAFSYSAISTFWQYDENGW